MCAGHEKMFIHKNGQVVEIGSDNHNNMVTALV